LIKRELPIVNPLGIHARPAALIVKTVNNFNSNVFFEKEDLKVSGRSVLGIMMLAAPKGSIVLVEVDGEDEEECLKGIEEIFKVLRSG